LKDRYDKLETKLALETEMLKTTEAEFNKSNKHFVVASMKLAKLKE